MTYASLSFFAQRSAAAFSCLLAVLQICLFAENPPFLKEADLSLFVIDLKYNAKQGVKICEIQPCHISAFRCSERGGKAIAEKMVELTSQYWAKDKCIVLPGVVGSGLVHSLHEMGWKNQLPQPDKAGGSKGLKTSLKDYEGAIYCRIQGKHALSCTDRELYPQYLFLEAISAPLIRSKRRVFELLETKPELKKLRPSSGLYPAKYNRTIAEKILQEIPSSRLVVKPTSSGKGKGVIIIDREQLLETMHYLFESKELPEELKKDADYLFWRSHNPKSMLVEEFIASDPIERPDRPDSFFDPTIRVVTGISCSEGAIKVHFLGKYMKYPGASLEHEGSLTKLHKSCANHPFNLEVSAQSWVAISNSLENWLVEFYRLLRENDYSFKRNQQQNSILAKKEMR